MWVVLLVIGDWRLGGGNEISLKQRDLVETTRSLSPTQPPIPQKNKPHILYSCSVSYITTWRWPTYTAETCSCIPTVLLGEIQLCSTVLCNTQKILCYWTNTTGMTHLKKRQYNTTIIYCHHLWFIVTCSGRLGPLYVITEVYKIQGSFVVIFKFITRSEIVIFNIPCNGL